MDQSEALKVSTNATIEPVLQAEIDKVVEIVEKSTTAPLPKSSTNDGYSGKWQAVISFIEAHRKKVIWAALVLSFAMVITVALRDLLPRQALFPMALIMGSLAELCGLSILLSEILVAIPFLYQLKKAPLKFFFTQLQASTTFDLQMVNELALCDPNAVRYVAKHYQYHRLGLEKRGGTISGNIDKLGLFPALGAVLLLWSQLSASPLGSWAVMLVPIIFIFHIINLYSFGLQQRMDRVIAGLEFSIASRKA